MPVRSYFKRLGVPDFRLTWFLWRLGVFDFPLTRRFDNPMGSTFDCVVLLATRVLDFLNLRVGPCRCAVSLIIVLFARTHSRASQKELKSLATERSTYRLSSGSSLLVHTGIFIPGRSPLYGFRQTQLLSERRYGPAAARRNLCPVETRRLPGRTFVPLAANP